MRVVCLHDVAGTVSLDPAGGRPVDLDRPPSRLELEALLERSVALTHGGAVRHFAGTDCPAGWRRAPILRGCRVAVLRDGRLRMNDRLTLRVDDELGVVVEGQGQIERDD